MCLPNTSSSLLLILRSTYACLARAFDRRATDNGGSIANIGSSRLQRKKTIINHSLNENNKQKHPFILPVNKKYKEPAHMQHVIGQQR